MRAVESADDLGPITTLAQLPKLRTLTAPQEAFFSVDEDFTTCQLPKTIERIAIIDSTRAANRFAKHILQNRTKWPDLTTIRLCLSREIGYLALDYRVMSRTELPGDALDNESDVVSDDTSDDGVEAEERCDSSDEGEDDSSEEGEDDSSEEEEDDSSDEEEDEEWTREFAIDNSIWEDLRLHGIIRKNMKARNGWRKWKW
jgi:hypothetical protein